MKKITILAIMLVLVLSSCDLTKKEEKLETNSWNIEKNTTSTWTTSEVGTWNLETNKTQTMRKLQNWDVVAIMTTNKGKITIFLDTKNAPITTANFIWLAKKWYYDGIIFHRIIKDFMIQWGDPDWIGTGGESIYGKKFADEISEELKNKKFSISMANSWPDTNGSQFFINVNDNNFLDWKYSVFGEVVEWAQNVLNISKVKTWANDRPEKEVKIIKLEIKEFEDGKFKDYTFSEDKAKKDYEEYIKNIDKIREEARKKELEAKKDLKISSGNIVTILFTLKEEDWKEVISTTTQAQVVEKAEIMSWLNDGLKWMKIWDKKTLTLTPEIGYWEYREDLKKEIPKTDLEQFKANWLKIEAWENTPFWKILEVKKDTILLDTNNPFAGKTMIIDFEVKDIN